MAQEAGRSVAGLVAMPHLWGSLFEPHKRSATYLKCSEQEGGLQRVSILRPWDSFQRFVHQLTAGGRGQASQITHLTHVTRRT